jgi:glycosyltransferase involved in cell wall biosynthesis
LRGYDWKIIIADNGPSRDQTRKVSKELVKKYSRLKYICIMRPGRGGALKEVWLKEKADILCYMDVDLSSDLSFFPELVRKCEEGADIAIGSRLAKGAKVYGRTLFREFISRSYNILIKLLFWTNFKDAQCGFKAIRKEASLVLLPKVLDRGWFFDTELLIIAEKAGYKIAEVPIIWRDDPTSTVKIFRTAWGDIKGLVRLLITRPWKSLRK